jgi:hypothetical protein
MEAEEVIAQQALQQFPAPGTGAVDLPGGPGDVPEVHDGKIRNTLAQEGRTEGEMIILEPDHGRLFPTLRGDHRGKGSIDVPIVMPVARLKERSLQVEVTQGPQSTIREAIVKASHLCLTEPDAPQSILWVVWRHLDMILLVNSEPIGTIMTPGYPGTVASLHDRV